MEFSDEIFPFLNIFAQWPYTANILTVISTAFGSGTFPTEIWLCMLQPKTAIDLKLYSSMSLSAMGTLGSEINVPPGINMPPGSLDKKNNSAPWNNKLLC